MIATLLLYLLLNHGPALFPPVPTIGPITTIPVTGTAVPLHHGRRTVWRTP